MNEKPDNYNLLEKPWIPILRTNGTFERVGIRKALTEAGKIRQIAASNPMDNVALLRLLLAVLQWIESADGSLADCAKKLKDHKDKFCLLSNSGRFMQAREKTGNLRPIADLFHELPGASNVAHFYHIRDYREGACPACIAAGLARLPTAMMGKGRSKYPGINGDPPVYIIPIGITLEETLHLNWPFFPRVPGDGPSWVNIHSPSEPEAPVGVTEGFTWTSRQFRIDDQSMRAGECALCGDSRDALITRLYELNEPNGRTGLSRSKKWRDPHVAYREKEKCLRPEDTEKNPSTAAGQWRQWLKRVIRSDSEGTEAPAAVIQAAKRCGETKLQILVVGLATRKDKSLECWEKSLSVPIELLMADASDKFSGEISYLDNAIVKILDPRTNAWPKPVGKLKDASLLKALATHDGQKLHAFRSSITDRMPTLELTMFSTMKRGLGDSTGRDVALSAMTTEWNSVLNAAILSTTCGSPLRRREATERATRELEREMAKLAETQLKEPQQKSGKKKRGGA